MAWKLSTVKIIILKITLIKNNLKIYFFHIFIVFLCINGQTPIWKGLVAFKFYALAQKLWVVEWFWEHHSKERKNLRIHGVNGLYPNIMVRAQGGRVSQQITSLSNYRKLINKCIEKLWYGKRREFKSLSYKN